MKKILAALISTTALLTVSAPTSSAELTGCVTKNGSFIQAAPGARPDGGKCRGPKAKKVSVPVALNAGKPGSARVDTYTFFVTMEAQEFPQGNDGIEVLVIPGTHYFLAGYCRKEMKPLEGPPFEFAIADTRLSVWGPGVGVKATLQNSDPGPKMSEFHAGLPPSIIMSEIFSPQFATITDTIRIVYAQEVFKVDAVVFVDAQARNGAPITCTFSGTAELFRAR